MPDVSCLLKYNSLKCFYPQLPQWLRHEQACVQTLDTRKCINSWCVAEKSIHVHGVSYRPNLQVVVLQTTVQPHHWGSWFIFWSDIIILQEFIFKVTNQATARYFSQREAQSTSAAGEWTILQSYTEVVGIFCPVVKCGEEKLNINVYWVSGSMKWSVLRGTPKSTQQPCRVICSQSLSTSPARHISWGHTSEVQVPEKSAISTDGSRRNRSDPTHPRLDTQK